MGNNPLSMIPVKLAAFLKNEACRESNLSASSPLSAPSLLDLQGIYPSKVSISFGVRLEPPETLPLVSVVIFV